MEGGGGRRDRCKRRSLRCPRQRSTHSDEAKSRHERKEDTGGTRWRKTARTTKRTTHPLIDAG